MPATTISASARRIDVEPPEQTVHARDADVVVAIDGGAQPLGADRRLLGDREIGGAGREHGDRVAERGLGLAEGQDAAALVVARGAGAARPERSPARRAAASPALDRAPRAARRRCARGPRRSSPARTPPRRRRCGSRDGGRAWLRPDRRREAEPAALPPAPAKARPWRPRRAARAARPRASIARPHAEADGGESAPPER